MSTDVVGKLWNYCHELRHIGINNNDYLEQITCLLFLKMADERGIELPNYQALDSNGQPQGTATLLYSAPFTLQERK